MSVFEVAQTYYKKGWCPIPLYDEELWIKRGKDPKEYKGKSPCVLWGGDTWTSKIDKNITIKSKWNTTQLGILVKDVFVVDLDTPDIVTQYKKEFPDLWDQGIEQTTKKGVHLWFNRKGLKDDITTKIEAIIIDGKPQKVDFKTCYKGNRPSVVNVEPSDNKKWINGIPSKENLKPLPSSYISYIDKYYSSYVKASSKPSKTSTTKVSRDVKVDDDQKQLILDILQVLDGKYCDDYSLWTKVGLGVASTLGSDGKDAFREFSKKSDKYEPDGFEVQWNQWCKDCDGSINVGSFIYWIKTDYPDKYYLITRNSGLFQKMVKSCATYDVAKYCELRIPNIYYDNNRWYCYIDGFWKEGEAGKADSADINNKIMETVHPDVIGEIIHLIPAHSDKVSLDEKQANKNLINLSLSLRDITFMEKVIKELRAMCKKENLGNELDTNRYLLGFTDDVFDLKKREWIGQSPLHYMSYCCKYSRAEVESVTDDQISELFDLVLNRIFPEEELREFMLDVYAKCLFGENPKKFFLMTGKGDNGKGFMSRLLDSTFGDYYHDYKPSLITEKKKGDGGTHTELTELRGRRLIIGREHDKNTKIKASIMKEMTGDGDNMQGRRLYATKLTIYKPMFSVFLECNGKPRIDVMEQAVINRITAIPFISEFTDGDPDESRNLYSKNPEMNTTEWRRTFAPVFMRILLGRLEGIGAGYNTYRHIPESSRRESQKWFEESVDFIDYLNSVLIKKEESAIPFKELMGMFRSSEYYNNMSKSNRRKASRKACLSQLKLSGFGKDYHDGVKMIGGRKYSCPLVGYTFDDDDEEEEEESPPLDKCLLDSKAKD